MRQKLQRSRRLIRYRLASHALILMYHRVTELGNDPHLLAVSPQHFAEQLEVIRHHGSPMPLSGLVQALRAGKVPKRAVVITFDDGYADNLDHAKPLLEASEIPATVFVTAGQVGSPREFWWDELDRLLLQPGALPARLQLRFNGVARDWDLGNSCEYTEADYRRDQGWHIEREDDPTMRQRLFRELFGWLQNMPNQARQKLLDELREWAGISPEGRPTHRVLTLDQAVCLTEAGSISVGAHTMTHPILADLAVEEQRSEIRQSKERLEAILEKPVTSFAFPHGSSTPEALSILAETGFETACTSQPDAIWAGADPFQLPRLGVRDWDRQTFARWLSWWMDG